MVYPSKATYDGEWQDGLQHGKVTTEYSTCICFQMGAGVGYSVWLHHALVPSAQRGVRGVRRAGRWAHIENHVRSMLRCGWTVRVPCVAMQGTYVFESGHKYEGQWAKGEMHGEVRWASSMFAHAASSCPSPDPNAHMRLGRCVLSCDVLSLGNIYIQEWKCLHVSTSPLV